MSLIVEPDLKSDLKTIGEDVRRPQRPAWVEIDLGQLRKNYELIFADKPAGLGVASVIKDNAYGHGLMAVARTVLKCGAAFLVVGIFDEAMALREQGIEARVLLLGERTQAELEWCAAHKVTCCIQDFDGAKHLESASQNLGVKVPVHVKINTGMNRYGVHWGEAARLAARIASSQSLFLEGVLSHFSMSDETDKSFALLQLERFHHALEEMGAMGARPKLRHICNSGGFLDLPQARLDMVRLGLIQFGVYPSKVCRRIPGIEPVMTVKSRVAVMQHLKKGDYVGYGLRYQATEPRRIAVIPAGYGDGFPRMRNMGCVLIGGKRAPLVGGVAMDAFTVDVTDMPEVKAWDEVVLMGRQGAEEISAHEVAQWRNTVSYDVLTGWRERLPRVYLEGGQGT
jgi:alanine racemase